MLDLSEDVSHLIEQLEVSEQRMLYVQSLIFCWLRDGEIASSAKINDGSVEEDPLTMKESKI